MKTPALKLASILLYIHCELEESVDDSIPTQNASSNNPPTTINATNPL